MQRLKPKADRRAESIMWACKVRHQRERTISYFLELITMRRQEEEERKGNIYQIIPGWTKSEWDRRNNGVGMRVAKAASLYLKNSAGFTDGWRMALIYPRRERKKAEVRDAGEKRDFEKSVLASYKSRNKMPAAVALNVAPIFRYKFGHQSPLCPAPEIARKNAGFLNNRRVSLPPNKTKHRINLIKIRALILCRQFFFPWESSSRRKLNRLLLLSFFSLFQFVSFREVGDSNCFIKTRATGFLKDTISFVESRPNCWIWSRRSHWNIDAKTVPRKLLIGRFKISTIIYLL